MVILIDDCTECRHHFVHCGSVVLCSYRGLTTARHVFEAPWGPVIVMNCPLSEAAEADSGEDD